MPTRSTRRTGAAQAGMVARLGADEFAIVLGEVSDTDAAARFVEDVLERLAEGPVRTCLCARLLLDELRGRDDRGNRPGGRGQRAGLADTHRNAV